MEQHLVRILSIRELTHDVRSYRVEKPEGYSFIPGQATEVCINKPGWENERRPFTFTSLNEEPTLEFTIKSYQHGGVTQQLYELKPGDSLILHDVWGAISYQGPGYFIAGGAGLTPFLAILRQLNKEGKLAGNKLFFANKSAVDIILRDELQDLLGNQVVHVLSNEKEGADFETGFVDEAFLRRHVDDFSKHFYLCGPPPMMDAVTATLQSLGAAPEALVFEK
ncbi:MAG: flavodoxin reductase [Bacteroidetes bacterium]|nr:flavodoxin reductase [Bacteroidota bacterium]MBS1629749.1 flavodoxin reductase [Bacteroidota bacterium]